MPSMTGIELGPDYCVLVRARRRSSSIEVTAVRIFEPDEWAIDLPSRTARLHDARRELRLPRHATVVAWDLAALGLSSSDTMLRRAGFTVDDVLSPSDALALLAWSRPHSAPDVPIAWLSINRHGAGLSVVRQHDLLYAREFAWRIKSSEQRAQAHLLRRYLYVAQLVPEMRKAMEVVREQHGATIETAVTCGNIPDLRSFTMPLIEQLDIEFETLDSLEGLHVNGELVGGVSQTAPMIRLAGAAAAFGEPDAAGGETARWLGAAAGLMLAAGAAWWAFSVGQPGSFPETTPSPDRPTVSAQGRQTTAPPPASPPVAIADPVASPGAVAEPPQPQPTTGTLGEDTPDRPSTDTTPLPLPTVEGILISKDRRLAVIAGAVLGVGDRVAGRIVSRIDADAVVFRESSGRLVRVPVRDPIR